MDSPDAYDAMYRQQRAPRTPVEQAHHAARVTILQRDEHLAASVHPSLRLLPARSNGYGLRVDARFQGDASSQSGQGFVDL